MAHYNHAVSLGFLITKHITKTQLLYYITAEITGAFLGTLFVKFLIGSNANMDANAPNYSYPIPVIFGAEVLASALLMGGIVGLDIFFLAFISHLGFWVGDRFNPNLQLNVTHA